MPSSGLLIEKNVLPGTDHDPLPEGYGETMAAMLPRDANWMFVYWEITGATKARIARENGPDIFEKARQVLRVHNVSNPAGGHFDVPVMFDAGSWYVHVQDAGRSYCGELGLVTKAGAFVGIVKSNTAELPHGKVSEVTDGQWMAVSSDFDKLLQLSGVEYIGKGSGEVAKSLAQRWEMLRAVFSRGASWGVSSMSSAFLQKPERNKFHLVADCELILYGATEPDAFVTVAGRKVNLDPDGTFSMRFALPDKNTELPVRALAKDGTEARRIKIQVVRSTEVVEEKLPAGAVPE